MTYFNIPSSSGSSLNLANGSVPFKVFVVAALMMLCYHLILGGLLYLVSKKILKKESDIKRIYALIGVNTTVSSIMLIIATLGLFLNLWITIIAVVASGILYFLNLYQGFNELSKVDKNHMVYAFASCYFITLFIVCYIIPKIFA